MEPAQLLMLIAVILAIVVIAVFLITVVTLLAQIWSRINTILDVVGGVVEKTEVLDPVISEVKGDLAGAEAAIVDSVQRLKARKGYSESQEPVSAHDLDRDREPAAMGIGPSGDDAVPPANAFRNY